MPFSYRELFFGGTQFCCCLPVRAGVITMSLLGIILSGILTIILWYEVASTPDLTSGERTGFVLAGLLETFLCVVSILGFVGAIVRKQLFVRIYAYFIYVHFFINVAVAAYLLWLITHFTESTATKACEDTIKNTDTQQQCIGILQIARGVYFVVAALVLLIEMYGAIIVARYLNQIQREKRTARNSRMSMGYKMAPSPHSEYISLVDTSRRTSQFSISSPEPYTSPREFNPYEEFTDPYRNQSHAGPSVVREFDFYSSEGGLPIEAGYGGGTWTHSEISVEEKARLQQSTADIADHQFENGPSLSEEQQRKRDSKSPAGPPPLMRTRDTDDLPRYSLNDPPRTYDGQTLPHNSEL
ncbi:hypothetical protein IW261DRAFT_1559507 [Armillaria novae-zelandiae]|uniref:Uncharacterized protein n=1 Tax=Armillaria novae-zelandiae TaxID=153914 RepID=A0AA39PLW8_9AGAR|nr:hypothetical protein IW261DRAFT_1559507 [Armillaria novae-zelandiae]